MCFLIIARAIIPVVLFTTMTNYLPYFLFGALFGSTDIGSSDSMFIKIRNEFFKISLEAEQPELHPNIKSHLGLRKTQILPLESDKITNCCIVL
jgi:hypothetical protein